MHNIQTKKDKFRAQSKKRTLVGYLYGKKDWKVYDIETGEIFVSRDVVFYEDTYHFASNEKQQVVENLKQSGRWVNNDFNKERILVGTQQLWPTW